MLLSTWKELQTADLVLGFAINIDSTSCDTLLLSMSCSFSQSLKLQNRMNGGAFGVKWFSEDGFLLLRIFKSIH